MAMEPQLAVLEFTAAHLQPLHLLVDFPFGGVQRLLDRSFLLQSSASLGRQVIAVLEVLHDLAKFELPSLLHHLSPSPQGVHLPFEFLELPTEFVGPRLDRLVAAFVVGHEVQVLGRVHRFNGIVVRWPLVRQCGGAEQGRQSRGGQGLPPGSCQQIHGRLSSIRG
jgi:hypothetical protein